MNVKTILIRLPKKTIEVHVVDGLVTVCGWCHKIRDIHQIWHDVDLEEVKAQGVSFSHAICPECAADMLGSCGNRWANLTP